VQPSRRRMSKHPLVEIGRAQRKDEALAGLERWKKRHPKAAEHLEPADVLVDAMRGRSSLWTRVRVNLQHVPEALRPPQEALDPDDAPEPGNATAQPPPPRRRPAAARKAR
jgi:bifunctional non-homologous end joining protein LigD